MRNAIKGVGGGGQKDQEWGKMTKQPAVNRYFIERNNFALL